MTSRLTAAALVILIGCGSSISGGDGGGTGGGHAGGTGGGSGGGSAGGSGGGTAGGAGGGGGGSSSSSFCSPCVMSAECGTGALCVGGVAPRCGRDCASTGSCPGGLQCVTFSVGKGGPIGSNCVPNDAQCGARDVRDAGWSCADTYSSFGRSFIEATCIGTCHRHDLAWPTLTAVRDSADSIRFVVESGSMPQGQALTEAERRRLLTWLSCGAP